MDHRACTDDWQLQQAIHRWQTIFNMKEAFLDELRRFVEGIKTKYGNQPKTDGQDEI